MHYIFSVKLFAVFLFITFTVFKADGSQDLIQTKFTMPQPIMSKPLGR